MGFSRQEHWSGLPFPSPGGLRDPDLTPVSPAGAGSFFTAGPGKPRQRRLKAAAAVQPVSPEGLSVTPRAAARPASLSFAISQFAQTRGH